jgi:NAD-dependent deacetylase
MNNTLEIVADRLFRAERILFITGAGLSADSGLPTYRGIGGLYEGRVTEEGLRIEEALSGSMLKTHPEVTWKYLWQIGAACSGANFNRGHEVIAEIEQSKPDTWVLTQNVDGLHCSAGTKNLIELHGRVSELYCVKCFYRMNAENFLVGYSSLIDLPPRCPSCEGLIRPDVVLFGEKLPEKALKMMNWLESADIDLVFAVGTSGLFPYISRPIHAAKMLEVPTVEINPCETVLSTVVDYRIKTTAAAALDGLWNLCSKHYDS